MIIGSALSSFSLKKKLGLEDPRNFLFVEYLSLVKGYSRNICDRNVKSLLSSSEAGLGSDYI